MKKITILISTLLFSLLSSTTYANRIVVTEVFGVMDRVAPELNNLFQIGDPFSGRFTIDLDAELAFQSELFNSTDGFAAYSGAGTGLLNIESSTSTQPYSIFNEAMKHYVMNNYPFAVGVYDGFGAAENSMFHGSPLADGSIGFEIGDPSASMFSGYSLPTSTPNFFSGTISLNFEDSRYASGSINRVTVSTAPASAVPITSSVWLLMVPGLFTLFIISFSKRRKRGLHLNVKDLPVRHSSGAQAYLQDAQFYNSCPA